MRLARGRTSSAGRERTEEQLGQIAIPRPDGYLLWCLSETADQAGPALALAEDLADRLEQPVRALITPMDEKPLAPGVAEAVIHQFAPGDSDGTVQRFLDHWRPDFCLTIGTPNRPQLLKAAASAEIPLLHAAAPRPSGASARRSPAYLSEFHTCLAATPEDAEVMRAQLKSTTVQIEDTGPLTDTVRALPCNDAECDDLAKLLGGRPVWLAANVSGIEPRMMGAAHRKAFRSAHRLLLILVPRQGEDAAAIAERFEADGWRVALRSEQQEPDLDVEIYIADTLGELGLWYRLSPVSFVGGSLDPSGVPTDAYAPAALGSAVLHGQNLGVSPARLLRLQEAGAAQLVRNADELGEAVISLLAPDKAAMMAQSGWATTTESAPVVERLAEIMEAIIDEREGLL